MRHTCHPELSDHKIAYFIRIIHFIQSHHKTCDIVHRVKTAQVQSLQQETSGNRPEKLDPGCGTQKLSQGFQSV